MRIGVPKEIKNHEYRVGLTPASVAELTAAGHELIVQTQAGTGIDFDDQAYVDAGARIVADAGAVFAAADMAVTILTATMSVDQSASALSKLVNACVQAAGNRSQAA